MKKARGADLVVWFNWALLVVALAGWPVSAVTFAKNEPQTVLALSWVAIIIAAMGNLITSYVNRKQDEEIEDKEDREGGES